MKFLKTIRIDPSDIHVFDRPAESGEWAIGGGFVFSGAQEGDLRGKAKQAFSNGFLSLASFGHCTFSVVVNIDDAEIETLAGVLAQHFVDHYGAPNLDEAMIAAREEISFVVDMCEEIPINSVFTVLRSFDENEEIKEEFRIVDAPGDKLHARVWDVEEV